MGVTVEVTGSQSTEISYRTGIVYAELNNLRACTLRGDFVSRQVQVSLVESLLHSKLFHCAQLWSVFSARDYLRAPDPGKFFYVLIPNFVLG